MSRIQANNAHLIPYGTTRDKGACACGPVRRIRRVLIPCAGADCGESDDRRYVVTVSDAEFVTCRWNRDRDSARACANDVLPWCCCRHRSSAIQRSCRCGTRWSCGASRSCATTANRACSSRRLRKPNRQSVVSGLLIHYSQRPCCFPAESVSSCSDAASCPCERNS